MPAPLRALTRTPPWHLTAWPRRVTLATSSTSDRTLTNVGSIDLPRTDRGRLIIVSNRLPVRVVADGDLATVRASEGGLATALRKPHHDLGSLWIGWPGDLGTLSD